VVAVLTPYERRLAKWLPRARVKPAGHPADAILQWPGPRRGVTYIVEHKANLEHQDVWAVAQHLQQDRERLVRRTGTRLLVFAPFIRREQGAVLERHHIDYVDLAGNAHLTPPGVFVHVEGLRPTTKPPRARRRMTRGWAKTVLTLLVRPELISHPYRPIAEAADVAPATVMTCLADLKAAGFVQRERGARRLVNARELLALWIHAYADVLRPKLIQRHFQIKIVDKPDRWRRLVQIFAQHHVPWTLTGADAALQTDPHLRTAETEIYAPPEAFDEPTLLRDLGLQPAMTGNLRVIEPPAPVALHHERNEPIPTAPLTLTYAELRYRNDDQANEAAELLLAQVLARAGA
jgi:hypothetical protein